MTKFNLSKKIREWLGYEEKMIDVEDVKEFIRIETELITNFYHGLITWREFWDKRNTLAGDELLEKKEDE